MYYSNPCNYDSTIYIYIFETKNKKLKFLEHNPKKSEILCIILIIFIIQYILASLTYCNIGWDVGGIINRVSAVLKNQSIDMTYFANYTNNIGIFLLIKYIVKIVQFFTNISTISDIFFVAIIVNIIAVDIAAIFTFLTIRKVLGSKSSYFSLIFIMPLIIFSPYIIIPYTDTLTMAFPIAFFYFYIKIKEQPKNNIKKYILILLEGILLAFGMILKPTVIIIAIAIIIIEFLSIIKKPKKATIFKNIKNFLLILLVFCIGFCIVRLCFSKLKYRSLNKYITEEMYYNCEFPFTHWLMMGMNDSNNNGHAGWNSEDVENTRSVIGYKEKQEYNIQIIKERLQNFGFFGYLKFLYKKANWVLSDGTFFYGREGNWYSSNFHNTSIVGKFLQKFINVNTDEFKNITANVMQILWILIIIGLIFSIRKKEDNDYLNIGKLTIIGIILFILIFEGRSRYLINHLPIFIFIATYGITNFLKTIGRIIQNKSWKKIHFKKSQILINERNK